MITKKRLATTAPTAALVVSFVVVLLLGQWIGSAVDTGGSPGSSDTSTVEQPPADEGGGTADTDAPPEATARRQVVVLGTDEDGRAKEARLPGKTNLSDEDLQTEPRTGWDGELETCVKLPNGSRVDGQPVSLYCTSGDVEFHVENR